MNNRSQILAAASLATLLAISPAVPTARGDIFQWEYVDPDVAYLGKQQSQTLVPDGAGADAAPGANLANRDLTKAYLIGNDLTGASASAANLTSAAMNGANLTRANLSQVNLTDADLAYYSDGYGDNFWPAANLTGANLSGATLTRTSFGYATMTGVNLTGADVRGADFMQDSPSNVGGISLSQLYSTASYQAKDLTGLGLYGHDLSGANFAGQNLTNVGMMTSTVTGANFTNAQVRGATLWGITRNQLYSTASYQARDLTGITLSSTQTGWDFAGVNLTNAYFWRNVDLTNANLSQANLTNADLNYVKVQGTNLSQANLTGANFALSNVTGATFTGADVRGASFWADSYFYPGSGLTPTQLYSTASYQARDLTGIKLRGNSLSGTNLANQNLTNADLFGATLTGANLTGANVRGVNFGRNTQRGTGGISTAQLYSTASYQNHDLRGINLESNPLAGSNFAGQNLEDARFISATLTNADFRGANLTGATFSESDTTYAYDGAYMNGADLRRANLTNAFLGVSTLISANLSEANLSNANLAGGYVFSSSDPEYGGGGYWPFPGADLTNANLSHANLTNANFSSSADPYYRPVGANLTGANLTGADARGANFQYATFSGATTTNLIQPGGHIDGLDLTAGATLTVRNYHGAAAPIIVVDQHLAMDATGTLRLVFDADQWDSLITFAPGIPASLGGTLQLEFAVDVDLASQFGRTIDLFDWTGVAPTDAFNVESAHSWDLSALYTTGEVTLVAVPEPGGLALLGLALTALLRRRRARGPLLYRPNSVRRATQFLLV